MIAEAPIRLLEAIGVVPLKRDSTLNVKGCYARDFLSIRRYHFYCIVDADFAVSNVGFA